MIYQCPVCGYSELPRPPINHLICPCCGTEFGYDDYATIHEQLRQRWMALGAPWFSHSRPAPQGWSALVQLMTSGFLPRTISLDAGVATIKTDMNPEVGNLQRVIATSQATQIVGVLANQIVTIAA
jgi:hypothetical protein